jgi:hypothetical protein
VQNVPFEDGGAVSAAHVVGDLGGERLVVHQQEVELPNVADKELLEAVGEEMAGLYRW